MPDQLSDVRVWHLGSTAPRDTPSDPWIINIDEPISGEEYESHRVSASLLDEIFPNSAFARFQEIYTEFKGATRSATESFAAKRSTASDFLVIRRKLDDLLTALRRFDDRTSHALSSRYTKDSKEYIGFKQALSHEFDTRFSYRFCFHLRNNSDHRESAIMGIRQSSSLNPDGTETQVFQIAFNAKTLLKNHDWPARVRKDLEKIDGDFPVEATIDDLYQACAKVHCKNLLSQEARIAEACNIIRSFAVRATTDSGLVPVFVEVNPKDLMSGKPGPLNIAVVRAEMIASTETALREAHQFA